MLSDGEAGDWLADRAGPDRVHVRDTRSAHDAARGSGLSPRAPLDRILARARVVAAWTSLDLEPGDTRRLACRHGDMRRIHVFKKRKNLRFLVGSMWSVGPCGVKPAALAPRSVLGGSGVLPSPPRRDSSATVPACFGVPSREKCICVVTCY